MEAREIRLLRMQDRRGGVAQGIRTHLRPGRQEITTAGFDPNLQLLGSDPWNSSTYTGLVVPTAPTLSAATRYLFQLARFSFNTPESAWLTGLGLYASLFGYDDGNNGPYEMQITSPMWRFVLGGGNISFHVTVMEKTWRDRRNPANRDSVIFLDAPTGNGLLYQGVAPAYLPAGPYVPPNGGRPWGKPISSDLGNIHDYRYLWRDDEVETSLCIPIPAPCDVIVSASVWQHATFTSTDPPVGNIPNFSCSQFSAATPEDRFWATYNRVQYGRIAARVIVSQEYGKEYAQDDDERDAGHFSEVPR